MARSSATLATLGTATPHIPVVLRDYQAIDPAQFDRMDAAGEWNRRQEVDGWITLDFDRAGFFKSPSGAAFSMSIRPTDPADYFIPAEESSQA